MKIVSNLNIPNKEQVINLSMSLLNDIKNKVNKADILLVKDKIITMNKGALKAVWDHVNDLWYVVKDNKISFSEKVLPLGALVYAITPLDAIPDLVPLFGLSDDAAVIIATSAAMAATIIKSKINLNGRLQNNDKIKLPVLSKNRILEQVKVAVSILSLSASADNTFDIKEKERCLKLMNFLIFAEEGYCPRDQMDNIGIQQAEIDKLILKYLDHPYTLDEIFEYVKLEPETMETLYFYAYSIAYTDEDINPKERSFLNKLSQLFSITLDTARFIEDSFHKEWLDINNRLTEV